MHNNLYLLKSSINHTSWYYLVSSFSKCVDTQNLTSDAISVLYKIKHPIVSGDCPADPLLQRSIISQEVLNPPPG